MLLSGGLSPRRRGSVGRIEGRKARTVQQVEITLAYLGGLLKYMRQTHRR